MLSSVFIGNPASTMSGFIARSRIALGTGLTYIYRARDEKGGRYTSCGDNCLFANPLHSNWTLGLLSEEQEATLVTS